VPGGRSAVFARAVGHRPPTPSARRLSLSFSKAAGPITHSLSGSRARRLPPAESQAKSMRGRVAPRPNLAAGRTHFDPVSLGPTELTVLIFAGSQHAYSWRRSSYRAPHRRVDRMRAPRTRPWTERRVEIVMVTAPLPIRATPMDMAEWLRGLGLEQYVPAFRDNDIDGEVLRGLTADDLRELGVASIGHRRRLFDAIARLVDRQPSGQAPPVGLTRFGGHPESLARGAADAKNTSTVFAGVSPTDGRPRPCGT
jgi:hypothetical protein